MEPLKKSNNKSINDGAASPHFFDEIMQEIGDSGPFQRNFNIIFNFFCVMCATMAMFNSIITIAVPEHWCHVPGRHLTNFTEEEWKEIHIPKSLNSKGFEEFNKCSMIWNETSTNDTSCLYGWDYNKTYYGTTISSDENWVCQNEMHSTNFLVFGKIGEIVGTTIFSQIGDIYGRLPVFYSSIITLLIGRLGLLLCSGSYTLFIVFACIGSMSGLSTFTTPMVISMEISSENDRAYIPLYQCVSWTLALCITPLIYWWVANWTIFILLTTLPLVPFLFMCNYMLESPRWLAGKGNMHRCIKQLKKIVKVNAKSKEEAKQILSRITNDKRGDFNVEPEKHFGAMSLFANWKMAKLSFFVILGWTCYTIVYIIFFLNVSNLNGNPFLNYFWQGLAELPGYFLGKKLCDWIGRKWTRLVGFIGLTFFSVIIAIFISNPKYDILISICGICLKCVCSVEFYAINLHTLEVYPTCLRQTGSAIGYLVASIFGIFVPYIIYLGTAVDKSYPYIFACILTFIGGIGGLFLPETLNEKLPETVKEASEFGREQKLWSWPKKNNDFNQHN